MLLSLRTALAERFYKILEKELNPKQVGNIRTRVSIVGDLYKWKPDIVDIWSVKKGKEPEGFEILWDGEFVCRFLENEKTNEVMLRFWVALDELVKNDKISFRWKDKLKMDEIEEAKRQESITKLSDKEKKKAKQMFDSLKTTEEKEIAEKTIKILKEEKEAKKKKIIT